VCSSDLLCEAYELREDRNTWKARYEWSIGERDKLLTQRDEALRQVQVLRDALDKLVRFNSSEPHISVPTAEITAARKALSGIRSPGVLCESEPVAWLSVDCIGERYLCFTKPNDKDSSEPLYRKKGETP
jgi:hypothetical protein